MQISSKYNYTNTNFKSFTVSYGAEESLSKLSIGILSKILKLGKKFEKTEYIDIELLSDLRFRIKEKGKVFSLITEPFSVEKPKAYEKKIKVSAIYDGVEHAKYKRGTICDTYIQYSSAEEAQKGYERICYEQNNIDKIGAIAKEMEKERIFEAEREYETNNRNNKITPLYQILLNKYGDVVREWKLPE